ncbi:MAG: FxsA family protein, partial [Gammaproteobacteria bacterium]
MRLLFFLLFIIIPVIEIYLFIKVGAIIGAGNTILIIFVTAIIGAGMLRSQGLQTLAKIQNSLNQFQLPARELVEGVLIVIGGAFLLTPGFFTDTIGFLFLIP